MNNQFPNNDDPDNLPDAEDLFLCGTCGADWPEYDKYCKKCGVKA